MTLVRSLQNIKAYRTIYALTGLKLKTETLQATHYACVLSYGSKPLWGLFSAKTGDLVRTYWSRSAIERDHPRKIFRRMQATWTLQGVQEHLDFDEREKVLRAQIREELLEEVRAQVRQENMTVILPNQVVTIPSQLGEP